MEEWTFYVTGKSLSGTKLLARVRDFEVLVDEPGEIGGTNEAPNPVEYLLVALAGCLNVTIRGIAEEKGIPVESLEMAIAGKLNPEKFQGLSGEGRAGFTEVTVSVYLKADAPREKIGELLKEAEERCPVTDNLINATPVRIVLKE
ncbi:OsmC family protein [Thermococcus sp. 21S7]|uniref:OsmC family protein n=1 Tax=Thermococcus sp. 21S7 TaxID=1638221 RepID=UPI00143CBABA|nr:OsmC family protein [Thermococcus sp. 21S7]NJE62183.1 OsmC family peroxiredoxin [Thermococcus sp. 21S7]